MSTPAGVRYVPPRPNAREDKLQAITAAARIVFGRDGYSRTSIDTIAGEAGVSTRTVYNHFESKERLFSMILYDSAKQVADEFVENAARTFGGHDAKSDLLALGIAFAARRVDNPDHFAMVDQIQAESPHFPPATIEAWYKAGAHRIETEIASRLEKLADRGLLQIENPQQAMVHFMALAGAGLRSRRFGARLPSSTKIRDTVVAGVEAFLNGYGSR